MHIENRGKCAQRFALTHGHEGDCWIKAPTKTWPTRAVAMQRFDGSLAYTNAMSGLSNTSIEKQGKEND